MKFVCTPHQHKAEPYLSALRAAGYRRVDQIRDCDFLLTDFIWRGLFSGTGPCLRPEIREAECLGKPIFLYPHSVRPNIPFDLVEQSYRCITAFFTIAEGHRQVLQAIRYPCPVEVAGWPYTPIQPVRSVPPKKSYRVLFAPLHPVGNGELPQIDRELNAATFRKLLDLGSLIKLTVRHIQDLASNGLWHDPGVRYVEARPDGSTADILQADLVVASYTFAYMTVALGRPLIMMGEEIPPHNTPQYGGKLFYAFRWGCYRDLMHYPYNIEEAGSADELQDMLESALHVHPEVRAWRKKFIGQPFSPQYFIERLETYLEHKYDRPLTRCSQAASVRSN